MTAMLTTEEHLDKWGNFWTDEPWGDLLEGLSVEPAPGNPDVVVVDGMDFHRRCKLCRDDLDGLKYALANDDAGTSNTSG